MADSYDEAQTALQQQQRDLLAAMAQAGSAGQSAFTQAQGDLAGQKQAAVQAALAEAARRGAPQGMQDSVAYQIGAPIDTLTRGLTAAGAEDQGSIGQTSAAGQNVIQEAIANIPALRAMSQRQAEAERFKQQQADAAAAQDMALKNIDLQIAQKNLDKSQNGGSGGPLGDMLKELNIKQKLGDIQQQDFKTNGGDRSNWDNAGPKARSVLELVVKNNDSLNGALSDLYLGQQHNWADPSDASKQLVDLGSTHLDTGALESWLRHYYGG